MAGAKENKTQNSGSVTALRDLEMNIRNDQENALTAFPDSAWTSQPVLRQVTWLAGIRAGRCNLHDLPGRLFQGNQWFEVKAEPELAS